MVSRCHDKTLLLSWQQYLLSWQEQIFVMSKLIRKIYFISKYKICIINFEIVCRICHIPGDQLLHNCILSTPLTGEYTKQVKNWKSKFDEKSWKLLPNAGSEMSRSEIDADFKYSFHEIFTMKLISKCLNWFYILKYQYVTYDSVPGLQS